MCRNQKQEKAVLERESNKARNALSENARIRRELQDDENHLVGCVSPFPAPKVLSFCSICLSKLSFS